MAVKAERVITDLFRAYQSEPAILPDELRKAIGTRGIERTICDYIAGMTDRFAIQEHEKLFNPLEKP
jgi:dGTPase